MTKTTEIKIVKSDKEVIIELVTTVAVFAVSYYSIHPDCLDRVRARIAKVRQVFDDYVNIWQTRRSIRSLPETP